MIRSASCRAASRPMVIAVLVVPLVTGGLPASTGETSGVHAGQPVTEAIDAVRALGLKIIYSTTLVRPGMRVREDPSPGTPLEVLHELLAPHGLTTVSGPGESRLVVEATPIGTIRGVVRRKNGGPLAGARVAVAGESASAFSDRHGGFELAVPAGPRTLIVEARGFLTRRVSGIVVDTDAATEIVVELASEVSVQESVVVHPLRPDAGVSVTGEELERSPSVADDALRAVARIAGAAESDLSARLNVRGAREDEMLIIVDGLEIHEPFHVRDLGGGMLGLIDTDDVAKVDFFRGGFPVKYGNRMGGVMDISSAEPTGASRTAVGVELNQARLSSRGRFASDAGSWLVSARRGSPEYALPEWIAEHEYDPIYYDLLGKVEYRLGDAAILSGNALFGLDESRGGNVFEPPQPGVADALVDTRYGNRYLWLNLKSPWTKRLASRTVVAQGEVDRDRRVRLEDASVVDDDRDFEFFGVLQDWSYDGGRHRLQWGGGLRHQRADYDYLALDAAGTTVSEIHAGPSGNESFAYLSETIRVLRSLEMEIGVRWDAETYTGFDDDSIDPRLNLAYAFGERTVARIGWGRFRQSQRIHELQVEDGIDTFFSDESSYHTIGAVEHTFPNGWLLGLGAYYKESSDLRPRYENLFDPTGFLPESQTDRIVVDADHAEQSGVELTFRGRSGPRFGWSVSYALSSTEDEIDGRNEPRSWDQRHAADASVSWEVEDRWRIGLAGTYHSGWPTTELTAELVDGEIVTTLGPRNGERLSSYVRFDVGARRSFHFGRHGLAFHAEVLNLLDTDNTCCVGGFDFVTVGSSVEVRRLDKRSLSRSATGGVLWTF